MQPDLALLRLIEPGGSVIILAAKETFKKVQAN